MKDNSQIIVRNEKINKNTAIFANTVTLKIGQMHYR